MPTHEVLRVADKQAITDMGITDPVEHMKQGIVFIQVPDNAQNEFETRSGRM